MKTVDEMSEPKALREFAQKSIRDRGNGYPNGAEGRLFFAADRIERDEKRVKDARNLVLNSPCRCISSGGLHEPTRVTSRCDRCRWLAEVDGSPEGSRYAPVGAGLYADAADADD